MTTNIGIHFTFKAEVEDFVTYEFMTDEMLAIDVEDSDLECDLFRLFAWRDGRLEIMVANSEDYDIHEEATYIFKELGLFDKVVSQAILKSDEIDDVTEDFAKYYREATN